jgi:putative DNA primase/helicase
MTIVTQPGSTPAQARLWRKLRLEGEFQSGNYRCPGPNHKHKDATPSLSVGYDADDRKLLLYCHAGCPTPAVLKALGLTFDELWDDGPRKSLGEPVATYDYTDADGGELLFRVVRFPGKQFRAMAPDGTYGINGQSRVLYRLPRVAQAVRAGEPIWVAEGEKDVLALEQAGVVATCNPFGAGKWKSLHTEALRGAKVTIVADKDDAGREHAAQVAEALAGVATVVRVVEAAEGKDAADHLGAGRSLAEFVQTSGGEVRRMRAVPNPVEDAESESDEEATWPPPSDPMRVARQLIQADRLCDGDGNPLVRWWRGAFQFWTGTHWAEVAKPAVQARLYGVLEHAAYNKGGAMTPWEPSRRKIGDLYEALQSIVHLDERTEPPAWLVGGNDGGEFVAMRNGLLHLGSRTLTDHTPLFFNQTALPYDWEADPGEPTRWLEFLDQLWPDDAESVALLQEWFGYVVSGSTNLHKILGLFGPPRSGKGTIARVLTALVGRSNVAGPTLASLGTNFGLQPLLGKSLAIVSDARLGTANPGAVVERLLSISGEDALTVDVKYREPWTGKLAARFVVISNELPNLGDASGAVATRFLVLSLTQSWLGHEKPTLTEELLEELPAVLGWSLEGLDRLREQGHFTEPKSSRDAVMALAELSSPVSAFVGECCRRGPGMQTSAQRVYRAWRLWCADHGRTASSDQVFGRDLRAVVPGLKRVRVGGRGDRTWFYEGLGLTSDAEERVTKVEEQWSKPGPKEPM